MLDVTKLLSRRKEVCYLPSRSRLVMRPDDVSDCIEEESVFFNKFLEEDSLLCLAGKGTLDGDEMTSRNEAMLCVGTPRPRGRLGFLFLTSLRLFLLT